MALVPRIEHLHAVDVENGVVIVAVGEIHPLAAEILGHLHFPAHPYLFSLPGRKGSQVARGSKGGRALVPAGRPVGFGEPVALGLGEGVSTPPGRFRRQRGQRTQLHFLHAEETVHFAVHLQGTDEREFRPGPMLHRPVVQVVVHAPGTGVRVDGYKRIGRSAQGVALHRLRLACSQGERKDKDQSELFHYHWISTVTPSGRLS